MKKAGLTKVVAALTIVCALITIASIFFSFILPLYFSYKFNRDIKNASSIGIIGGADGPTAIYLSGGGSSNLITVIFASLTFLGVVYLVIAKKRKRG